VDGVVTVPTTLDHDRHSDSYDADTLTTLMMSVQYYTQYYIESMVMSIASALTCSVTASIVADIDAT
jgi:hypothetical protein